MHIILKNANVLTMESDLMLKGVNILVKDGMIEEIGDVTSEGISIDIFGKYILPGLCDAHFHTDGENVSQLEHTLAHGVTHIRNMWGFDKVLMRREETKEKGSFIPDIYTACNIMDGNPPVFEGMTVIETEEQAREAVRDAKDKGYDFVKVYNHLKLDVYKVIIDESKRLGLDVIGHVPLDVGHEKAIELGQYCFEHCKAFPTNLLEKLGKSGAYFVPTLTVMEAVEKIQGRMDFLLEDFEGLEYLSDATLEEWKGYIDYFKDYDFRLDRPFEKYVSDIKIYHDAKGKLLCGTDAGFPLVMPGSSLFDEMDLMKKAGLSNYEVLETATINCFESMHMLNQVGTVTVGKKANLIIVDGNPLENLDHLRELSGLLIRGEYYSKEDLSRKLEDLKGKL